MRNKSVLGKDCPGFAGLISNHPIQFAPKPKIKGTFGKQGRSIGIGYFENRWEGYVLKYPIFGYFEPKH